MSNIGSIDEVVRSIIISTLTLREIFIMSCVSRAWLRTACASFSRDWQLNGVQEVREFIRYTDSHIRPGYQRVHRLNINLPNTHEILPAMWIDWFRACPNVQDLTFRGAGAFWYFGIFAEHFERMDLRSLRRIDVPDFIAMVNLDYLDVVQRCRNSIRELNFWITRAVLHPRAVAADLEGFIASFNLLEKLVLHPTVPIPITFEQILRARPLLLELDIKSFTNGQDNNLFEINMEGEPLNLEPMLNILRIPARCCIREMFNALGNLFDLTLYGPINVNQLLDLMFDLENIRLPLRRLRYQGLDRLDTRLFLSLARWFPRLTHIDVKDCAFGGMQSRNNNIIIPVGEANNLNISIDFCRLVQQNRFERQLYVELYNTTTHEDRWFYKRIMLVNTSLFRDRPGMNDNAIRNLRGRRNAYIIRIETAFPLASLRLYNSRSNFSQTLL